jgi:hypothetical protein
VTALWFGLPLEYDVIGDNYGVRPEVVAGGPVHGLRAAIGALPSRENLFVPVSVGWRARTGPDARGHALFGAGGDVQSFWFSDAPPHARFAYHGELGGSWSASDRVDLGALLVPELAIYGVPGIGLGVRVAAWLR